MTLVSISSEVPLRFVSERRFVASQPHSMTAVPRLTDGQPMESDFVWTRQDRAKKARNQQPTQTHAFLLPKYAPVGIKIKREKQTAPTQTCQL